MRSPGWPGTGRHALARSFALWPSYRAAGGPDHDDFEAMSCGDSAAVATELAELVLSGTNRAAAFLARAIASGLEAPRVGGHVVVDGDGRPRLIRRTSELRVGPLISVDDDFARDEGAGDLSRTYRLDAHRRHFARRAARAGLAMRDGIEVVFERCTVLWPPEAADR